MKSAIFAGLLATVAVAQPHKGHQHQHQKKDVVIEWVTQWETVTEIIDDYQTQTIYPAPHSTTAAAPTSVAAPSSSSSSSSSSADVAAKFVETLVPSSSTSQIVVPSSSPAPVVVVPSAPSVAPPAAPTTTLVPVVSIPSVAPPAAAPTTTLAPVVSIPPVVAPAPAPAPSSTIQAAAAPAPSSGGSSSAGSSLFSGDITYYVMGPTACGDDFTGQDSSVAVAALSYQYMGTASSYGPNQPANEHCGRKVEITANGKTVIAKVQDKCMGCEPQDIDVSEKVFLELFGTTGGGRLSAQWREIS